MGFFVRRNGNLHQSEIGVLPSINVSLQLMWHRYETLASGFNIGQPLLTGFTDV